MSTTLSDRRFLSRATLLALLVVSACAGVAIAATFNGGPGSDVFGTPRPTRSTATAAATSCSATRATTRSTAARPATSSRAAAATTRSMARTAPTRSSATASTSRARAAWSTRTTARSTPPRAATTRSTAAPATTSSTAAGQRQHRRRLRQRHHRWRLGQRQHHRRLGQRRHRRRLGQRHDQRPRRPNRHDHLRQRHRQRHGGPERRRPDGLRRCRANSSGTSGARTAALPARCAAVPLPRIFSIHVASVAAVLAATCAALPSQAAAAAITVTPGLPAPGDMLTIHARGFSPRAAGTAKLPGAADRSFRFDARGDATVTMRLRPTTRKEFATCTSARPPGA